jgi:6-phosphofructokinase 1
LATNFGVAAVHLVAQEKWGYMVALRGNDVIHVPIERALKTKRVDIASTWVQAARDLGIVLG